MTDERFKAWLTFGQFFLGTVVLGIVSTVISHQIQTREVEIKEQDANAKFLEQALQENVGVRRRLAQYFSHVTRSAELRERWGEYAKLIEAEYQDTLAEKKRSELLAAAKSLDPVSKDRLFDRIDQLDRELSPRPSGPSRILPRVYIQVTREDQRDRAMAIAEALVASDVLVPPIEVKEKGPSTSQLRYFKRGEREEAEHLASVIRGLQPDTVGQYVPGYEASTAIRPRHYELWLSGTNTTVTRP